MFVKRVALYMLIQSALTYSSVWAAERQNSSAPAIEMSESATSEAGEFNDPAPQAAPAKSVKPAKSARLAQKAKPAAVTDIVEGDASSEKNEPVEAFDAAAADAAADAADDAQAAAAAAEAPVQAVAPPVAQDIIPASSGKTPEVETVSWWREAASFLGLAPDPHPGEIAEPAPGRPQLSPDYIIGPGDLLGISVWRDENLTRSVVVLPDGKVAFPLVGELIAGGKTVAQLKQELERKLARYITDAGLTVEVKQSNSMIIYIIGRVNVPGRQLMVATTNVLQGLAMAGGPNPFARRSEVKVFRKQDGKTSVFSFNYDDVAQGKHLETNIDLQKGDVILVP
jgi:polysaccharide biosynthesis/export protein